MRLFVGHGGGGGAAAYNLNFLRDFNACDGAKGGARDDAACMQHN